MTHAIPDPTDEDESLLDNLPSGNAEDAGLDAEERDPGVEDRPREDDGQRTDVESP